MNLSCLTSIRARSSGKRSEPFDTLRVYLVTSAATLDWWVHGPNARAHHVQVSLPMNLTFGNSKLLAFSPRPSPR